MALGTVPNSADPAPAGVLRDDQHSLDTRNEFVRPQPTPQDASPIARRIGKVPPGEDRRQEHDQTIVEPRKGRQGRRLAYAIALLLAVPAAASGYVYWDYAKHFESTDDAFIATRQFAIAPKVSGYITAVPVTDNQHVATGDVIARIDDRDYRTALAQAQAQAARDEASIQNIDAQISVQQAQ